MEELDGEGLTGGIVRIDPKEHPYRDVYKLMIGSIVPRPIALVSSLSADGKPNLAPFSFFNGVCSKPPIVCFSTVVRPDGQRKDTVRNIEATREFVVNIVSEDFAPKMNLTSEDFPYGVNEFERSGLTPEPAEIVKPSLVRESRVRMECRLVQVISFGDGGPGSGSTIFGEVVLFHVADAIVDNFRINAALLKPVARMGGPQYARTTDIFEMPRPGAGGGGG